MGMYTELAIGIALREETPAAVIDALKIMVAADHMRPGDESLKEIHPSIRGHELFATERWFWMLRSGGSYYFDAKPCLRFEYDDISSQWYLTVWTNIKNYSCEWRHFLDFLAPHIVGGDDYPAYIGHTRYEEDELPTLLYSWKKQVHWVQAPGPEGWKSRQEC